MRRLNLNLGVLLSWIVLVIAIVALMSSREAGRLQAQPEQVVHIYQLQCQTGGEKMYLRPGSNEVVDWIGLTLPAGSESPYVYCAITRIR